MEKMKLNIQLFGASVSLTASETAVDDTAINNNQTYINLAIRVQTTKPTWNGNKTAYYQVTTTSQNNGTQTGSKYYFSIGSSTGSGDKTFNVTLGPFDHNADGTLNNVSISVYVKITDNTNRTATKSVVMATIPRASNPTLSSSSVNMGSAVTINTNRYSTAFTHTIRYWFGNDNGTIATNVTDSVSWTPPLTLANQIPNATSGVGTIYCDTYSGGTLIGTKTVGITLNVPTNVVPTISNMALQENGDVPSNWGVYVQNKSKIKVTYSASGAYSSTISSYTTAAEGYTYTNNGITTNYIRNSGNITINGSIVDSRGRQATTSQTPYIYPYANPTISTAQIQRCDINGNIDNNGEYMFISYGASISSCNGNNTSTFKVGYRVHNVGSYSYVPLATNVVSFSASGMLYTDGIYAADRGSGTKIEFSSLNTYDIQFYVADYFATNDSHVQQLDTGFDLMNFNLSGKAMAIGKVSEASASEELFEVGIPTKIDDRLNVTGDIGANGVQTKFIELGGYQMSTPFIDFHYENDFSVDYTSRIIENTRGTILIDGKLNTTGGVVSPDVFLKPIGNRLLYYGSVQYTGLWVDVVKYYSIVENYSWQTLRNGYKRWFRFLVWKNDNATSDVGLQLGLFDQSGNYKGGYNIARSWGSGTNEWGSYFASTFIGLDTLNIGWTQIKAIIPSGSNGTSGYIFSLSIEAYDIPTGIDPNNL